MAATTEEKLADYDVLEPLKSGGQRYQPGDKVRLTATEAKELAAQGLIRAKPVKAKVETGAAGDDN